MNTRVLFLILTLCCLTAAVGTARVLAEDSSKTETKPNINSDSASGTKSVIRHPNINLKRGRVDHPTSHDHLKSSAAKEADKHPCPGMVPPACRYFNDDDGD